MHFMVDGQTLPAHKAKQAAALKKLSKVMRLLAILMLAACMQVSARGYSQNITLSVKHASLEAVLNEIKKQSGYQFFFSESTLAKSNPVTLEVKDQSIEEVLKKCFEGQPFTYAVVLNTVVIKDKLPELSLAGAENPDNGIRGRVINSAGEPLAYANITVKRTKKGTITDANGFFTLKNVLPEDELIVSYIGYKNFSIRAGNGNEQLNVILEAARDELDAAVVQAYGTTTQRLTTSNIGKVTAAEIERQPVSNPLLALQGRVAGLDIVRTSGWANAPVKVELRGRGTIDPQFTSDPMYIIDGVPLTILEIGGFSKYQSGSTGLFQNINGFVGPAGGQSPLFGLNPLDIESIEVLKDASATAIYGSRGANGVILITTKKGKAGKTAFNLNITEGIDRATRFYEVLNTQQYLAVRREALKNDGYTANSSNAYDLVLWDTTRYTDWQRALYGHSGKKTNVYASLSGGDAYNKFAISAGYGHSTNILTVSGANQVASVLLNVSHSSRNQRFNVSVTGIYSSTKVDMKQLPGNFLMAPNAPPIFDSIGNLNFAGWGGENSIARRAYPFTGLKSPYVSTSNALNGALTISYQPVKGLSLTTSMGYNNTRADLKNYALIASQDPLYDPTGSSNIAHNINMNWIIEPRLSYSTVIGKGSLNTLIGGTFNKTTTEGEFVNGVGYTSDALIYSMSNAQTIYGTDSYAEYKYAAVYGRLDYGWDKKYILELSGRRDGSSRFGSGRQYGNFGSVGVGWILSAESWFRKFLRVISFAKLRGSYGTTGNDAAGDYKYLTRWTGTIPYNGNPGLIPTQHANPYFQWQVNKKLEGAIDVAFIKDRIHLLVVYYRNRCGNQLVSFPIPAFTGFNNVYANSPALVQNTGWEFSLSANIIRTKDFDFSINANASFNKNKLVAYPDFQRSPYVGKLIIGQPLNITRLLHATGVDPLTGQYMFADKNHDGKITYDANGKQSDDTYVYYLDPKFGGMGMDFRYKGFSANLFFIFKRQIGKNSLLVGNFPGTISTQPVSVLSPHWQKPGDITNAAAYTTQPAGNYGYYRYNSDGTFTDASYIRLSNISLNYQLPSSYIKKIGLQSCVLFVNTQNLFTITRYKGIDPETQNFGSLPPFKTIVGGINFNF